MRCLLCLHASQLEDGSTEARSLSHCLSQAWFPPLGSNQADKEEQDDTEKVLHVTHYPFVT